ncbi:MAG TPA: helix-turn-helix transcriptional regulator [Candidatus Paceibacterota bacterium]
MPEILGTFPFTVKASVPKTKEGYEMREIVAQNIQALMNYHGMTADAQLAQAAGIDQKTIWRMRRMDQSSNVDKLESIANVFGLKAWQLLIPHIDPAHPPVCIPVDRRTKRQ